MHRPCPLVIGCLSVLLLAGTLFAGDGGIRITLPKRSKATPVQKLNQEGVAAVKKHDYEKAKKLFYRAYLLDPDDPFTLNNLGYMAELEGDLDRAQRFYQLSAEQRSDATVVASTSKTVQGKAVSDVAGKAEDAAMNINRYNVAAISLLNKDRAPEADLLLQKALALDPKNPFTLNNLGFTREKEGEYEEAMNYYQRSAFSRSEEPIVVTMNPDWRGKPISEIAAENANKLRKLMEKEQTPAARVVRLNLQGVSAINRNDHDTARKDFLQAYKLDPQNAFTLNNMGYLAELDGDRETADFYYAKAQEARGANARVTMATRLDAEGKPLGQVARVSDTKVNNKMEVEREAREREGGPVLLRRRDNSVVIEPDKPPEPLPEAQQAPPPQEDQQPLNQILQPLPDNQQPGQQRQTNQPTEGGQQGIAAPQSVQPQMSPSVAQPLPENPPPGQPQPPQEQPAQQQPELQQPTQQPPAMQQPPQQQGPNDNGLIMPLPDDKQPGQTQPPQTQPAQQQVPRPPAAEQPAPQPTVPHNTPPQPQQGQVDNGLIMPLPDNAQPSSVQPSGMPPAPAQAQPQTPPQPAQGQIDNGLIMPLPDNQQPAAQSKPATPAQKPPAKKKDEKPKVKKIIIQN